MADDPKEWRPYWRAPRPRLSRGPKLTVENIEARIVEATTADGRALLRALLADVAAHGTTHGWRTWAAWRLKQLDGQWGRAAEVARLLGDVGGAGGETVPPAADVTPGGANGGRVVGEQGPGGPEGGKGDGEG